MVDKFFFVEALESACWRSPGRQMVVSLVEARWAIDGAGVDVLPNVVYSFASDDTAHYLLTVHENERGGQPRCVPVFVEKGNIVAFHREDDAMYFVQAGKARQVTDAEVAALFRAEEAHAEITHAADDAPAEAHAEPHVEAETKSKRKTRKAGAA